MSGDSKIGIVGGIVRTAPVRKLAASVGTPASPPTPRAAASGPLPTAGLIRLASDLAAQPVPVDTARIAALRGTIAEGRYAVDPAKIAGSMLAHLAGSAD